MYVVVDENTFALKKKKTEESSYYFIVNSANSVQLKNIVNILLCKIVKWKKEQFCCFTATKKYWIKYYKHWKHFEIAWLKEKQFCNILKTTFICYIYFLKSDMFQIKGTFIRKESAWYIWCQNLRRLRNKQQNIHVNLLIKVISKHTNIRTSIWILRSFFLFSFFFYG